MFVDDRRQVIRPAEQRQTGQIVVPRFRLGVDEADEIQTVFGMAKQLAGDALTDIAGAEDERVLVVERTSAAERTCDAACESDEHDRGAPQHDGVRHGRISKTGQLQRGEHEPRSDRDQVEDADDVVGRRVVRALLILVVQVIETRDCDPHGKRDDGRNDGAPIEPRAGQADYEKREGEPYDVGDDEHATNEPAAPSPSTGRDRSGSLQASSFEERNDSLSRRHATAPPVCPDNLFRSHHVKEWGFQSSRSRPDPKTVPNGLRYPFG